MRNLFAVYAVACLLQALTIPLPLIAQEFDLVINNGRVMDPETKLDAVRNVGINNGRIEVVTDIPLAGKETIDASGHVVAPGFIDFHMHGQDPYSIKIALRDGVTSPLELEVGAYPVDAFYDARKGKSQANYGCSASHVTARLTVLDGIEVPGGLALYSDAINRSAEDGSKWSTQRTNYKSKDRARVMAAVERAMRDGAVGIGFPVGYYTSVSSGELAEVASLAERYDSFILTHVRYMAQIPPSGFLAVQEMLSVAQVNDVPLVVQHVPSNCLALTGETLAILNGARRHGIRVGTEFYPYTKGSSIMGADYLAPGFQERMGMDYSDITIVATGETLTKETFEKYRKDRPGELMIMNHIKEADMLKAFVDPYAFVGADAMPFIDAHGNPLPWDAPYTEGRAHPRASGTHAKVLRLVRENKMIPLMLAIAKLSYFQAKFLEDIIPEMRMRGRIQPGAIADITIFHPDTVTDNSDYPLGKSALPSTGIPFVIVNGTIVVKHSEVLQGVYPGQAIRGRVLD